MMKLILLARWNRCFLYDVCCCRLHPICGMGHLLFCTVLQAMPVSIVPLKCFFIGALRYPVTKVIHRLTDHVVSTSRYDSHGIVLHSFQSLHLLISTMVTPQAFLMHLISVVTSPLYLSIVRVAINYLLPTRWTSSNFTIAP